MKLNNLNNILIKILIFFISFFVGNITYAAGVSNNTSELLITTINNFNELDPTKYPDTSIYTLSQNDSAKFVITKYLSYLDEYGFKAYSPVSLGLSIDDLILDSLGANYIYYQWSDSLQSRTLEEGSSLSADFYVQYASDTYISDLESYLSSLAEVPQGDFYYVYDAGKFAFSTSNTNAVYAVNYDNSYATISVDAGGFMSIFVDDDISDLGESGSWIFNATENKKESINANFYGVNISTDTDLDYYTSIVLYGGVIYNENRASIGDITGDFIGNYAKSEDYKAYGGAIFNSILASIGDISGDFVGNYVYSLSEDVYGGAISNYYEASIGDITGDFVGNYGYSETGGVKGGAISNDRFSASIGDIVGDFIGNYAYSGNNSYGGAIFNASGIIDSITGDFIGNYVKGDGILAWGGAICNTYDSSSDPSYIGDIVGNFIGNYAESLSGVAKGGAIFNREVTIANITGDFIANYSIGSEYVEGAVIYNYKGYMGDITGDFIGNYAISDSGYVEGGVIFGYYEATFGTLKGDFLGNYADAYSYVEGAVLHSYRAVIDAIDGDFVGNYALAENSYIKGGIIYAYFESNIGDITGDFIANYAISENSYVYGGVILNYITASMGNITGDFIYNYAEAYGDIYGGVICNGTTNAYTVGSSIGNITGDFIGNYALSENNDVLGGVIYNEKSTILDITGDFISNYADGYTSAFGGAIYNYYNSSIGDISGDFIGNYTLSNSTAYGGAIYNNYNSSIGDISGSFIANYALANSTSYGGAIYNNNAIIEDISGDFIGNYAESTSSTYNYAYYAGGGAIYNYNASIGDISGNFIANYVSGAATSYGGAIYNRYASEIGYIYGSFIGNYTTSEFSAAYGGAICNYSYADIGDIVGDFISNYSLSETSSAYGGAIYNYSGSAISSITGDFIANYISAYKSAYGGAIYSTTSSKITSITGDFIANYALSETSSAIGGAIYNTSYYSNSITGDFIANYSESSSGGAYGGAVYNGNTMTSITGDFIANYTKSSSGGAYGGAVYNYYANTTLDSIVGDFAYNYASSQGGEAGGGAVYNFYLSTLSSVTGDFIANYVSAYSNAYGGAIYNNEGAELSYISGDFIGNYALASSGVAYGGAISNMGMAYDYYDWDLVCLSTIGIENANFINNYASGESAYGGAIYNDAIMTYSLEAGAYAVATGNSATSAGGFLYNIGDISFEIESGALFSVGVYQEDDSTDSIYNAGSFVKSGAGTMLIRSNFINEAYSDSSSGGSIYIKEGELIIEGTDEAQDLDSVWFYSDAILSAINDAKASFVLGTSMNLGAYLIIGTYTGEGLENTAYFGADSVFAVHVETTGSTGDYSPSTLTSALVGDGSSTVIIESGAVLLIYGASAGTDIRILEDFDGENSAYAKWDVEYISSANPLYEINVVEWRTEESAVATISDSGDEDISAFSIEDEPAVMTLSLFSVASINEEDSDVGVSAIDEDDTDFALAIDDDSSSSSQDSGTSLYISTSVDEDVVDEVGKISEIGGVVSNMGLLINLARDTTMARFSVFDKIFYRENETNFGVWATPMANYTEARGLNAGTKSTGYDMYFGGANLGVDYTLGTSYRLGFAFHGGYGETNSTGDFSPTNNDFGFYSLTLYNGAKIENLLVYADVNFAMTNNDLTQYNSSGAGNFYADVDAYAISAELRLDYLIEINTYHLIPHIAFNYMYLSINDYDVEFLGDTVLNVDSQGQSIFSIPVGLSLTKAFDIGNDYFLSPILDLGVVFSLGDLYSKSTASFVDIEETALSVQAYNDYTFTGLLALECRKGNTRFGLSYMIEASENIITHNFRLNYRYEF